MANRRTPPDAEVLDELQRLREENERLKKANEQQHHAVVVPPAPVVSKPLPEDVRSRQEFADRLGLPDENAPVFNLVNDFLAVAAIPWADALVPAYLLDKNYRIVDWNLAFGLAFDHTMDGRRGLSVREWVCFLDNYEAVFGRAVEAFNNPERLPRVHVEDIEYTSSRFGKLSAVKRAYQVPADNEDVLGWLVTLDVTFGDGAMARRYKRELFESLRRDLAWSEYALSYDRVLMSSRVYVGLLGHILGEKVPRGGKGKLLPLSSGSRILDLGAGTGNLAERLAKQERGHVIFAVENNRLMLDFLRDKCRTALRSNDEASGILAIKQDANTLFGLPENSFDCAILNNVLYALEDPLPCLRQVRKRLKPDGEIRVSGPQKKTDLNKLFARIAADVKVSKRATDLAEDYDRVWQINRNILSPHLYRWNVDDMKRLLLQAGFGEITYETDAAYGGQAMIVCAKKNPPGRGNGQRPHG